MDVPTSRALSDISATFDNYWLSLQIKCRGSIRVLGIPFERINRTQATDSVYSSGFFFNTITELYTADVSEDIAIVKTLTSTLVPPTANSDIEIVRDESRKMGLAIILERIPIIIASIG